MNCVPGRRWCNRATELESARLTLKRCKPTRQRPRLTTSTPNSNSAWRAALDAGRLRGRQEHFLRARDLDTLRFRADSKINDINRSVASSFPGSDLVDADAVFSKASPNGIIGSELVYEHVHLTP